MQTDHHHRGRGAGDQILHLRVLFLDVPHKAGTAGGAQHPLLHQLFRLPICHHISPQSHLGHSVEAQLLQSGHHLAVGGGGELPHDGGGQHGIGLVAPVLSTHDHVDGIGDERLVLNGAEWALIHTVPAGDALAHVNGCFPVRAHGDGLGRAALLTGPLGLENGAVLTGGYTSAAGDALFMVDTGPVIHNSDGILGAGMDAPRGQASPAGGPHGDLGHRTLVTGDRQHLHQAGVALVPSHSQLDPAVDDGPLLINTAAQRGRGPGDDLLRDVQNSSPGLEPVLPGQAGHLCKHRGLQFLDLRFKCTHCLPLLSASPVFPVFPLASSLLPSTFASFLSFFMSFYRNSSTSVNTNFQQFSTHVSFSLWSPKSRRTSPPSAA